LRPTPPPKPPGQWGEAEVNQSINRSSQKLHTQLREAYPTTTTWAANPASRSDAGLGG